MKPNLQSLCRACFLFVLAISSVPNGVPCRAQGHPPGSAPVRASAEAGVVTRLQEQLDRGQVQLRKEAQTGYLVSLLEALEIPQESQLLVFSKTSCQREKISRAVPRAIYFNDRAYVAWIPSSGMLEISQVVPGIGAVFHTLDQEAATRPQLVRRDQCLECHTSTQTENIPGYLVRSYGTDPNGVIDITDGASMVDHTTPFAKRWGGWYLSGSVGRGGHRGQLLTDLAEVGTPGTALDLGSYPQATSDVVPLLVLEHQARMQNLLTKLHDASTLHERGTADPASWKSWSETVLRYLLFVDEAPLPGPVAGNSQFSALFEKRGPYDRHGRSLRQFDLQSRLFKFPCSYMIYSASFDALPRATKLHLYRRLWVILNGEDSSPTWASLTPENRRAVREILLETKADVPVYWRL